MQKQNEIMSIAQEECAEIIQAISKVIRFGFDNSYDGKTNREHLEEEIGDLLCMFELMEEANILDWTRVAMHASNKRTKLERWTNIFK
jgi:NTP pyrophosphatase (non-canonical NTP hydrolase)